MAKIRFSDGQTIETGGRLRVQRERDGWYVVGEGILEAVASKAEGLAIIQHIRRDELLRKLASANHELNEAEAHTERSSR
jgi:hypothetical protein